jgi:hypothetical protein
LRWLEGTVEPSWLVRLQGERQPDARCIRW